MRCSSMLIGTESTSLSCLMQFKICFPEVGSCVHMEIDYYHMIITSIHTYTLKG